MDSTSVCSVRDFPYNTHNKMSHLQATAIIRERLTCRHAVAKVRLLFKSGFYTILYGMLYDVQDAVHRCANRLS